MTSLAIVGAGLVLVIILVWWIKRQASHLGEAKAKNQGLSKAVEDARDANAVAEDVAALSDDELYDELYGNDSNK